MSIKSTTVRFIQIVARTLSAVSPALAARLLARLFVTPMRPKVRSRARPWMRSARRQRVRLADGRAVPIYSWGDVGHSPTVLLVHGWSGRASQLHAWVDPLLERGYRVVSFDGPGHGEAEGRTSSLPEHARALLQVAAQLGPVHAVVAHSMGSAATALALSWGLEVERAVFLAPPENPPGYLGRMAAQLHFSPEVVDRARALLEARLGLPFEEVRGRTIAPHMHAPLLVLHDPADREVPFAEGAWLAQIWPGARLQPVTGLGHHRILSAPPVVAQAVEFLAPPALAAK